MSRGLSKWKATYYTGPLVCTNTDFPRYVLSVLLSGVPSRSELLVQGEPRDFSEGSVKPHALGFGIRDRLEVSQCSGLGVKLSE